MKKFSEYVASYIDPSPQGIPFYAQLVAVPFALLSVLIFLGFFKIIMPGVFATSFATLFTLALFVFYLKLHWKLALLLLPLLIFLLWISHLFSYAGPTRFALWSFLLFTLIGWGTLSVLYFIGFKRVEGSEIGMQLLLLPLILLIQIGFLSGYFKELEVEITHLKTFSRPEPMDANS